jgi:hypothetical protein
VEQAKRRIIRRVRDVGWKGGVRARRERRKRRIIRRVRGAG